MNNNFLNNTLLKAEVRLILCMMSDVSNYEIVSNKIQNLSFVDKTCNSILSVMKNMYTDLGYNIIDTNSIESYCLRKNLDENSKKEVLDNFNLVFKIKDKIKTLNFDAIFEEYSMITSTYRFYSWIVNNGGIDEVSKKLLDLKNMSEVSQVIEGRLLEFFNFGTSDASIRDTDITDMIDDNFIKDIENKETIETVKLLDSFKLLNRIGKGFPRGITGFGAHSGVGKSSFMYSVFVISMLENSNSKIAIYANEQTAKVFTIGMVFAFLSQVFNMKQEEFKNVGYINLSRDKYINGSFSDEEIKKFIYALKLFKYRYKNRITHSYFEDMTPSTLKRDVAKKVRSGHKFFFYDTFKDNEEDYKNMMKLINTFDQLTKKYPIHAYVSLQLSDDSIGIKYLTNRCLASARGTKRVMELLYLMRKLDVNELPYLKVHKLGHEEQSIPIDLKNKNYYALFIDKNRNGQSDMVLLLEIYLDILKYKEIGVISNMPRDDYGNTAVKKKTIKKE